MASGSSSTTRTLGMESSKPRSQFQIDNRQLTTDQSLPLTGCRLSVFHLTFPWKAAAAAVSQGDVAVLLRGVGVPLGGQDAQRPDQLAPRLPGLDDFVHITARRRHIGIGEL